jgi:hypothetical protein
VRTPDAGVSPTVAAGAAAATGSLGPQAGAQLAAGVELPFGSWRAELRMLGRAFAETEHSSPAGFVSIQEVDVGVDARIGVGGELAAAIGVEASLRHLAAEGIAPWAERGEATRWTPAVRVFAEGLLSITPLLAVRATGAGELSFIHRRFSIGGQPIVDVGRFRFGVT